VAQYSAERVRRALLHFLVGKAGTAIASFVFVIVCARALSVEDYGKYVVLLGALAASTTLISLGLEALAERFLPEIILSRAESVREFIAKIFLVRLGALLALAVGVTLIHEPLFRFLNVIEWGGELGAILSLLILFGLFRLILSVLDCTLHQKQSQVTSVILIAIKITSFYLIFTYVRTDFNSILYAELAGYVGAVFFAVYALKVSVLGNANDWVAQLSTRNADKGRCDHASQPLHRRMRRFAQYNYSAQVLLELQGPTGLRVLAGIVAGPASAAGFGVVLQVAELVQRYLPTTLLIRLIRPVFVSRYVETKRFETLNGFATILIKFNLLVLAPLVMMAIAIGSDAVEQIAGAKYNNLGGMLSLALLLVVTLSHTAIISLIANTMEMNFLQLQGGVFALFGTALGVWLSGPLGVSALFVGAVGFGVAYNVFAVWRLRQLGHKYVQDRTSIIRIWCVSGVLFLPLFGLKGFGVPVVALMFAAVGVGAVYLTCLKWMMKFSESEMGNIAKVLPARFVGILAPW